MIKCGFFNSIDGDRKYNAEDFTDIFDGILSDGVFYNIGYKFNSYLNTGNNRVYIQSGKAWFKGKYFEISGEEYVTYDSLSSQLNRIDYVCIKINLSSSGRTGELEVVQGIEGTIPVPPTLPNIQDVYYYPIAQIKLLAIGNVEVESLVGTITPWAQTAVSPDRILLAYEGEEEADPVIINYRAFTQLKTLNDSDITWGSDYNGNCKFTFTVTYEHVISQFVLGQVISVKDLLYSQYVSNPRVSLVVNNASGYRSITYTVYTNKPYNSSIKDNNATVKINVLALPYRLPN